MEKHEISLLNDYYGALLTERQRSMLELFYNEDMSLGEIAQQFSVSRQAVRDAILRGESALLEFEKKLRLILMREKMLSLVNEILSHSGNEDIEKIKICALNIKDIWEE